MERTKSIVTVFSTNETFLRNGTQFKIYDWNLKQDLNRSLIL